MIKTIKVLSFGAGTQSTALLLLALEQKIEIDIIIFADTGAEPEPVYKHLEKMRQLVGDKIPFLIAEPKKSIVQAMEEFIANTPGSKAVIPLHSDTGLLSRQCTGDYKIIPLQQTLKRYLGIPKGGRFPVKEMHVHMIMGITTDEIRRVKPSREKWITNVYPLIDLDWSRQDAIAYVESHGVQPPRSACYFCPFRSNPEWLDLKHQDPESFEKAVSLDKRIRRHPRLQQQLYLHGKRASLDVIVNEYEQLTKGQMSIDDYLIEYADMECFGSCEFSDPTHLFEKQRGGSHV